MGSSAGRGCALPRLVNKEAALAVGSQVRPGRGGGREEREEERGGEGERPAGGGERPARRPGRCARVGSTRPCTDGANPLVQDARAAPGVLSAGRTVRLLRLWTIVMSGCGAVGGRLVWGLGGGRDASSHSLEGTELAPGCPGSAIEVLEDSGYTERQEVVGRVLKDSWVHLNRGRRGGGGRWPLLGGFSDQPGSYPDV